MIVVVDSLTGQGERFALKLGVPVVRVNDYHGEEEDILLLTRSYNFGEVPMDTQLFMAQYSQRVKGIAVSGNRNWGANYGAAGDRLQNQYGIPLIHKYEGSGFTKDVDLVKEWIVEQGGSK